MGFGVDAAVALRFNEMRKSFPWLFVYQPWNIIWYALHIVKELNSPTVVKLTNLHLEVDGKEYDTSSYQCVVLLNIPFFCGGGTPLGTEFAYSQCNDGEIEVVGFSTIPHVLKAKFGLSKGVVIAKGKSIHWRLSEQCPVEADGEPWMQGTSEGVVTRHDQVMMLVDSAESIQQTCEIVVIGLAIGYKKMRGSPVC